MLLQLCVVIVIQMTSSQPTCDVIQPGSDVCGSRGRTEQTLNQLMMVLSQFRQNDVQTSRRIEHVLNQLGTFLSQSNNRTDQFSSELATLVSQLRQSDVANSSSRADSPNQLLSELVPISCQLQTAVSQLQTTASRLQKDIAQLKAATLPTNTSGICRKYIKLSIFVALKCAFISHFDFYCIENTRYQNLAKLSMISFLSQPCYHAVVPIGRNTGLARLSRTSS